MARRPAERSSALAAERGSEPAPVPTGARGMTLVEVMVSLFIVALTALSIVPMFAIAVGNNATGGDDGILASIAIEQIEDLLAKDYYELHAGGSLTHDIAGYSFTDSGFIVRWTIVYNTDPANSKTLAVRAIGEARGPMPGRQTTLTVLRARP